MTISIAVTIFLNAEDDAQTSSISIAQRKRTIPHLTMKSDVCFSDGTL